MAYQVIPRKYRPQRFSDVVGQEHVTQTLARAVEQKRIAHAYLFCGPRGTGKTTIARIFAKCLNCTDGPKADVDDKDPRCQEIAEGRSIDVLEIDGASNRGIEEIRELRETVKYVPASSRFKIYIIDEVHMLTKEAFNALLKTLEEPPAHVKFMFATTEPEKVIPTILSRCQRFDLRRIPVPLIVKHLGSIAKKEKVQIEPAALHAIARGADGGMRDAECALDQLISLCGDQIAEPDVLSMFGLTAQGQVLGLTAAIIHGDAAAVIRELDELSKHGKDLSRLLSDILGQIRNLLVWKVSGGNAELLEITDAEREQLTELAPLVGVEPLTHMLDVLADAEARLRDAASKKIFVEVALLKAIEARQAVSIDSLLRELNKIRSGGGGPSATAAARPGGGTAKTRSPSPSHASRSAMSAEPVASVPPASLAEAFVPPVPIPDTAPTPSRVTGAISQPADLAAMWQTLLDSLSPANVMTRSCLVDSQPVSLQKDVLTVGFHPERLELVNTPKTLNLLKTRVTELGWPALQFRFVAGETSAAPVPPSPQSSPAEPQPAPPSIPTARAAPPAPAPAAVLSPPGAAVSQPKADKSRKLDFEEFKNDPLIRRALELFRGQIVDVRG